MKILGYDYQIKQFIFNHTDKNKLVTSILEVGCGTGITGLCLLKIFCHANLLLTDNNIKFIHTLEKKTSKENAISLGVSDISHPEKVTLLSGKYIQIKNETYDVICAGANIGYSICPHSTLSSLYDILKPGGYIIDLEMRSGFWGRLISKCYGYETVSLEQINSSLRPKDATISSENISWKYFPLNLTRVSLVITKPL